MSLEETRITLNSVRLYAYHGVLPQERLVGGWYTLDISADYPFDGALASDDVEDTLDYSKMLEIAEREMAVPSKLLEHVAGRILGSLFEAFPKTRSAEVSLTKENPPMGGDTAGATVRLRAKNDKCVL